jgi:hypothetical protein
MESDRRHVTRGGGPPPPRTARGSPGRARSTGVCRCSTRSPGRCGSPRRAAAAVDDREGGRAQRLPGVSLLRSRPRGVLRPAEDEVAEGGASNRESTDRSSIALALRPTGRSAASRKRRPTPPEPHPPRSGRAPARPGRRAAALSRDLACRRCPPRDRGPADREVGRFEEATTRPSRASPSSKRPSSCSAGTPRCGAIAGSCVPAMLATCSRSGRPGGRPLRGSNDAPLPSLTLLEAAELLLGRDAALRRYRGILRAGDARHVIVVRPTGRSAASRKRRRAPPAPHPPRSGRAPARPGRRAAAPSRDLACRRCSRRARAPADREVGRFEEATTHPSRASPSSKLPSSCSAGTPRCGAIA